MLVERSVAMTVEKLGSQMVVVMELRTDKKLVELLVLSMVEKMADRSVD